MIISWLNLLVDCGDGDGVGEARLQFPNTHIDVGFKPDSFLFKLDFMDSSLFRLYQSGDIPISYPIHTALNPSLDFVGPVTDSAVHQEESTTVPATRAWVERRRKSGAPS